jgi:hypothetical protein
MEKQRYIQFPLCPLIPVKEVKTVRLRNHPIYPDGKYTQATVMLDAGPFDEGQVVTLPCGFIVEVVKRRWWGNTYKVAVPEEEVWPR